MKILVTGSSGTIGTRLCERLLEDGHQIAGLDWVKNKWQPAIDKITTLIDLRDDKKLKAVRLPVRTDIRPGGRRNDGGRQASPVFTTLFPILGILQK